jgi:hypothetical protein
MRWLGSLENPSASWVRANCRFAGRRPIPIDWGVVRELASQGKSIPQVALEIGVHRLTIDDRIPGLLDPASPAYDPELVELLRSNGRAVLREKTRERWADPEYAERMRERGRTQYDDPVKLENMREKMRAITKERWKDPAYVDFMRAIAKERWKDPAYVDLVRKKMPQWNDFWGWLSKFDEAKQAEIMMAMHMRNHGDAGGRMADPSPAP